MILRSLEEDHGDCVIHETCNVGEGESILSLGEEKEDVADKARGGGEQVSTLDSFIFRGPTVSEPWHWPSWTGGTWAK